jgi:hypothetical protein
VGTTPDFIADREPQFRRFQKALDEFPEKRRNFVVTGLRGVGKTVLLKEYETRARDAGWVVIREDWVSRYRDEAAFIQSLVANFETIITRLSAARKLSQAATKALNSIRSDLGFELADGVTVTFGASKNQAPLEERLAKAMATTGKLAQQAGRPVLLLYDEAHEVRDRGNKGQFPLKTFLNALVDVQDKEFPIMLGVSGLPPLQSNLRKARTHAERLFEVEQLDYLSLDAGPKGQPSPAAKALIEPARRSQVKFDPDTAERIAGDVDGYPYFIQRYGDELWDAAFDAGLDRIDDDVYESQRNAIEDKLDIFYEGRFDDAKPADQQTLSRAGSLGGETFTMKAIQELVGAHRYRALQQSIARLDRDGLLYRVRHGEYAFTSPRFGDFLRRKHPLAT